MGREINPFIIPFPVTISWRTSREVFYEEARND